MALAVIRSAAKDLMLAGLNGVVVLAEAGHPEHSEGSPPLAGIAKTASLVERYPYYYKGLPVAARQSH